MIDASIPNVPMDQNPTTIKADDVLAGKVYTAPPLKDHGYSASSMYAASLESGVSTVAGLAGLDTDGRAQYLDGVSTMFQELSIPPGEAAPLHDVIVSHMKKPATQDQIRQWNTEVEKDGRYSWGAREYEERLELVRDYLDRRPALRDQLARSGALAHPRIVRAALSAARGLPRK